MYNNIYETSRQSRFDARYWMLGAASLVSQLVKNLPAVQETLVRFVGREDPLDKNIQATPTAQLQKNK